ncbi:ABC transporter permease [Streptomyces sp. NBC_00370]|uniref:ABC transporter permease n=1 Tax=Streptomyces sp. NBC_00370 TaxID=2975728 RepID=UPI002E269846
MTKGGGTGRLAVRTLRFRKSGFLATFVALFFGTAIVMACGGLMETGIRNNVPPERLAGATAVVVGDRSYELHPGNSEDSESAVLAESVPLDAALAGQLARTPGVERVVGDVTFPTTLLGAHGPAQTRAEGHGWDSASLAPYTLDGGRAPAGPREVVLDAGTAARAGAAVGDTVTVAAHGGAARYRVSGIAAARDTSPEPALFFAPAEAARLGGHPGTVGAFAVVAKPGTDAARLKGALASAVGTPVTVLTGDDRGLAEHPDAVAQREDLIAVSGVFGGTAVMVSLFVTAGTMTLAAARRRRELALLRAIGATPRQLRRMLLTETLAVAVGAILLAWLPGKWLGRELFDRLAGGGVTDRAVEFSQGWIPVVTAGGALLLTALGAGFVGARRAVKAKPVEALADSALQQRWFSVTRLVFALVFLAGAAALSIVTWAVMDGPTAASTAVPTVICAAIGLALIAPALTKVCAVLLHGPVRALTGVSGRLAMLNSRARTVHIAGAVAPVLLAVGFTTASLYVQTTTTEVSERSFTENLRADAVLTSASGTVDAGLADRAARLPGVAAASAYVTSVGYLELPDGKGSQTDEDGIPLQGVSARGAAGTTAVAASSGSFDGLRGDTIALPEGDGHRTGDTVTMRFGDGGTARLRVVATYRPKGTSEAALLPVGLLAPHTTAGLPQQVLVTAKPGTDVVPALAKLAAAEPGLAVADRDALVAANTENSDTQAAVNYLMVGVIIAYTAISVINSLSLSTGGRRGEFGLQRLTGATRAQIMRMMTIEGLVVAAIGVLLGTAASLTTLVPYAHVAGGSRGWLPSGPGWIYGTVVGVAVLLSLSATLVPTWRALRIRPAEAAGAAAL